MGVSPSSPEPQDPPADPDPPTPPADPLLSSPWRKVNWGEQHNNLQVMTLKNYSPQAEGQQLRILLYGVIGVGKSSFINSVDSVLQGRICNRANVASGTTQSNTREYKSYSFRRDDPGTSCSFVINDIMGLEEGFDRSRKIHVKDVKRAMKGHMRDGYTLNPGQKLTKESPYYNEFPAVNDKVHVLVCVADVDSFSRYGSKVMDTLKDISNEAADLKIPLMVLLTKIDILCPEIGKDVRNVYKSKELKEQIRTFSLELGVPETCIFPVKNYSSENTTHPDTDALILDALRSIINTGDDFLSSLPLQKN